MVIDLTEADIRKALQTFAHLGFHPRLPVALEAFADPATRASWVRGKNMTVFSLWKPTDPGFVVDLFAEVPFEFESAYQRAVQVSLPDTEARVVALDDLLEMKRRAGRSRDEDDVRALREPRKLGSEET